MPNTHPRVLRALKQSRGTSLLEMAFVLPLLLLLTFGIIEFAAIFYVYLALENGVSQATRYAITGNSNPGMTRAESIKAAMRQATPTISIPDAAFSFSHLPRGGSSWLGGLGGPGELEKVTVDYTWTTLTPLMRPFFGPSGQLHISVASAMKNENLWMP